MEFNTEDSQVWKDANELQVCPARPRLSTPLTFHQQTFRKAMSELPEIFAIPRYAKPQKIKLKVPARQFTMENGTAPTAQYLAPAVASTSISAPPKPSVGKLMSPVNQVATLSAAPMKLAPAPTQPQIAAPQPQVANTHYPQAHYQQQNPAATQQKVPTPANHSPPAATSTTVITPTITTQPPPRSPTPDPLRCLQHVCLMTQPRGRPIWLQKRDGVRNWYIRLLNQEKALRVAKVQFIDPPEEDKEDGLQDVEMEDATGSPASPANGRLKNKMKGKTKGKAVKRGASDADETELSSSAKKQKTSSAVEHHLQITLNGKDVQEDGGQWPVELVPGSNVVEVGEKGGTLWRVYIERPGLV
jgi:hypothetical protein